MTTPSWIRWALLAVLGLAVAAAVSLLASKLVSERIGLASEPLTAGRELAPRATLPHPTGGGAQRPPGHHGSGPGSGAPTTPPPPTSPTTTPTTPPPVSTAVPGDDQTSTSGELPEGEQDD